MLNLVISRLSALGTKLACEKLQLLAVGFGHAPGAPLLGG